jgi:hypothetical protein
MKNIIPLFFIVAFAPLPATASSMMECEIVAVVTPVENTAGQYRIDVKKARTVNGGGGFFGTACAAAVSGVAEVEGTNIPAGREITLKFSSYSAMGANGPISGTRWVYEP